VPDKTGVLNLQKNKSDKTAEFKAVFSCFLGY
jgi:hypothetical protein